MAMKYFSLGQSQHAALHRITLTLLLGSIYIPLIGGLESFRMPHTLRNLPNVCFSLVFFLSSSLNPFWERTPSRTISFNFDLSIDKSNKISSNHPTNRRPNMLFTPLILKLQSQVLWKSRATRKILFITTVSHAKFIIHSQFR